MNKYLAVLTVTAFLGTGCKTSYQKGFEAGHESTYQSGYDSTYNTGVANGEVDGAVDGAADGYNDGFDAGYDNGWVDAFDIYATDGYKAGYGDGAVDGYNTGYSNGHVSGTSAGSSDGYADGQNDSYNDNYNSGYSSGSYDGDSDGYSDGYYSSYNSGYNSGYSDGDSDGYWDGYDDGYDDGYYDGLGNTASKNPTIALASRVNADLVNYAALPKFDRNSVSSVALNHADGASVDLEKLAALKEQFYLNAIKNQISANYGLSAGPAMKIANVLHQFNKSSNSRELTSEDASAFSKSLIGFDMNAIESAVKKSAKGESSDLNSLMDKAAGNLDMSPENFNNMITKIFF